ncbi:MAG: hypothetical protein JRJ09_12715 [Deltaproteobacteria bacterium]|nr:hypothetical protein [Deltaproteobacteria bacterium]MBW2049370.1 hypothetical protein [Deltaproteobacteria bacterium]MBW2110589.1 hypothetical protein [Deltaproteobacteria bacterium]MBW2354091.1 hypothetical protein [Deltaproteobacteria bacterium]HDZ89950.1 hypothetical protein [Deltaproteobacteria bacterium]
MRTYLIDELSPPDMEKIRGFLRDHTTHSSLDQIFWVRIPDDLLSETQFQHRECQPHVFAMELGPDWVRMELFVRTLKSMRCHCPAYCTTQQRNFIFNFADSMIKRLKIRT